MSRLNRTVIMAAALAALVSLTALAEEPTNRPAGPEDLPEGRGLAARYPGDVGIESDPAVVFVENFEQESFADLAKRWESVRAPEIMSLSDDVPAGSGGRRSLLLSHVGGQGDGGHLYRRLPPGHNTLHVRFHVKFDPDCAPMHHFFHVGGYHPSTPYPQGGAGQRPRGNERFSVGIEPFGEAWAWDYYAYWMEMRGSPPRGQTWGNWFIRDPELRVRRGEWICMETMIKLNDVGQSNGELALWIDGKRVSHLGAGFPRGKWIYDKFTPGEGGEGVRWDDAGGGPEQFRVPADGAPFEGFRWRDDERLQLNFLWVLFYMTRAPEGHVSRVWFDDIVVAQEYIGPLAGPQDKPRTVRIGAAQPKPRLIDDRLKSPAEVLEQVDRSLTDLEQLVHQAGEAGCDTTPPGPWTPSSGASVPEARCEMLNRPGSRQTLRARQSFSSRYISP